MIHFIGSKGVTSVAALLWAKHRGVCSGCNKEDDGLVHEGECEEKSVLTQEEWTRMQLQSTPEYRLFSFNCASFVHTVCKEFVQRQAEYSISSVTDALTRNEEPIQFGSNAEAVAQQLVAFLCEGVPIPKFVFPIHSHHHPTLEMLKRLNDVLRTCKIVAYDATTRWPDGDCNVYIISVTRGAIRHIGLLLLNSKNNQYSTIGQGFMHYGDRAFASSIPDWTQNAPRIAKITSPDKSLDLFPTIGTLNPSLKVHAAFSPETNAPFVRANVLEYVTTYCEVIQERVDLARAVLLSMLPFSIDNLQTRIGAFAPDLLRRVVARMFCCFTTGKDCPDENLAMFLKETHVEPVVNTIQRLKSFMSSENCIAQITALDAIMRTKEITDVDEGD